MVGMLLEVLALLSLGFLVGLSGAVIPGPLLAFTVFDTSRKRRMTGHLIIAGHAIWELVVILVILLGFGGVIAQGRPVIYVIGGLVIALMGVSMARSRGGEMRLESSRVASSTVGGIFYTAFNPTQPPWWATAGLALLLQGIEVLGLAGVVLVTAGHWLADFVYYILVSSMVHRNERYLNPHQRMISALLAAFLILLGGYFFAQGLPQLIK